MNSGSGQIWDENCKRKLWIISNILLYISHAFVTLTAALHPNNKTIFSTWTSQPLLLCMKNFLPFQHSILKFQFQTLWTISFFFPGIKSKLQLVRELSNCQKVKTEFFSFDKPFPLHWTFSQASQKVSFDDKLNYKPIFPLFCIFFPSHRIWLLFGLNFIAEKASFRRSIQFFHL